MKRSQRSNHIAMLPPPGFLGHLIPFIELSKKLVSSQNCHVTLIIPHDGTQMKPQKTLLQNLRPSDEIDHIFLPPVNTDDLTDDDLDPQILFPTLITRALPHLRNTLSSLKSADTSTVPGVSALVVDLFASFAIDVAREIGVQAYIFYVVAASELALSINLHNLEKAIICEFRDLPEPLKIPGSSTVIAAEDLPDAYLDRSSKVYEMTLEIIKKFRSADKIIVNTFLDLEGHAFAYMEQRRHEWPPVYPIGPLIRLDSSSDDRCLVASNDGGHQCLKWLDDQPRRSVLYVSFGSGGTLSREQFDELARGLEMSGQRFLWVVRSPQENAAVAYLNKKAEEVADENVDDPLRFLPSGFLERVKDRGFLVANWAPQVKVLGHESIGGFMTHGGWNSVLESIVFGVPLLVRPLVFEQNMNAVLVADCLKAGIRLKEDEAGIVCGENIAENAKELMQGESIGMNIRNKMSGFKNAAMRALESDGSSTKALAAVFGACFAE